MLNNKTVTCIIPARLQSTRFPRKMLTTLAGRPLLSWVWDAANTVQGFDEIIFAVDDQEIGNVIADFGGRYVLTSPECKTGTDRLVELYNRNLLKTDIIVNWQGDEPFIIPEMIYSLLQTCNNPHEEMWTLKKQILKPEQIFAPNNAKVVCDAQGYALYFSRAPIPFFRDEQDPAVLVKTGAFFKHVGLYAFTKPALHKISVMGDSVAEDAEKLEMLRWLDYGLRVRVHETNHEVFGIDTPSDLAMAEERVFTTKQMPGSQF